MGKDGNKWDNCNMISGTFCYDGYPTFNEWDSKFEGYCGMGSNAGNKYYDHLPVWIAGNAYFNGAKAWHKEEHTVEDVSNEVMMNLIEENGKLYLETNLYDFMKENT